MAICLIKCDKFTKQCNLHISQFPQKPIFLTTIHIILLEEYLTERLTGKPLTSKSINIEFLTILLFLFDAETIVF